MTLVDLNPLGRLTYLVAVPPQVEKPADSAPSLDWAPLLSAAGLDPSKWSPAQSAWTPPVYSDARAAWTGSLAERPGIPMRIEAAAYRGRPVYFELIGPWTRPSRTQPYQMTAGERAFFVLIIVFLLLSLVAGAILARNLRLGRGDRQGAFRLAAFVFAAWAVSWFLGAHHVSRLPTELGHFFDFLVWASGYSCFTWLLYIALEPYVRRRWPATLVSWSRLLAGGIRDPLVGRDVLVGCLAAASLDIVRQMWWFVPSWLGHPPTQPYSGPDWQFLGAHTIIASIADILKNAPLFWRLCLYWSFSKPCCARSGRQLPHSFFC